MMSREASSTVGPLAEQTLADLSVNKVFLGTQALDLQDGLTDTTLEIAQVKRAMIKAAKQVILLADSAKWDHTGLHQGRAAGGGRRPHFGRETPGGSPSSHRADGDSTGCGLT